MVERWDTEDSLDTGDSLGDEEGWDSEAVKGTPVSLRTRTASLALYYRSK